MTYTTLPLSASINGEPIEVTGVDTANSVLVHTAINVAGDYDQPTIYANNTGTISVSVTLEVGGVAQTNLVVITVPAKSKKLLWEGLRADTGIEFKAFATVANVVNITGEVGRTE